MPIAVKTEADRAKLGTKWTCGACEVRFYDLHKLPATCPKCGVVQDDVVPEPPKKKRKATRKKSTAKKAKSTRKSASRRAPNEDPEGAAAVDDEIELEGHALGDDIATETD